MGRTAHCPNLYAATILAPRTIRLTNTGGAPVVRTLGVAAASAALIGTIAAVLPADLAAAAPTPLPSPVDALCATAPQTNCWRGTSFVDGSTPVAGTLPAVSGTQLVLNNPEQNLANAVWWN